MRKWSMLVWCYVLALAIPALGQSNPMVVVEEDVLAEIVSISRTVVYNYHHYDGPMLVYEEPSPQTIISLLIQPVDGSELKDIFLREVRIDGKGRSFSWGHRVSTHSDRPAYIIDLLLEDIPPSILQRIAGHSVVMDLEFLYGVEVSDGFELVADKRPTFTFELEIP